MALKNAKARRPTGRVNRSLIEARLDAGLTPNDLARRAQISGNTVRSAEKGFYVDPRSQAAMCLALGAARADLFPFERQKEAA